MLRGVNIPSWFNEAVAIQANERISCHPREDPGGDAYLTEREESQGIFFSGVAVGNRSTLNDDFYYQLKEGQATLSDQERRSPHIIGALYLMGLKNDYDCKEDCLAKIVQELRQSNHSPLPLSNALIKTATEKVTAQKVNSLWELLGLNTESN